MLIACLPQFASDMYAPALMDIARALNTDIPIIQQSMAIYMLGIAASQLIYGICAEAFGRKKPLIVGFFLMLAGSLICICATLSWHLLCGRLLQGIGAGASAALWRAMFRDRFSGDTLSQHSSILTIMSCFFVPAAPALGGLIAQCFGWRMIFFVMIIYLGILIPAVYWGFKETDHPGGSNVLNVSNIKRTLHALIFNSSFMRLSFCTFMIYGVFFTVYVFTPPFFLQHFNMTVSQYGIGLLITIALATLCGGFVNARGVSRYGMSVMLQIGFSFMQISGWSLLLLVCLYENFNLYFTFALLGLFQFGALIVLPNLFSKAFSSVGHMAGYAGAVYSLIQIGGAATWGELASLMPTDTLKPLAVMMIISGLLAWFIFASLTFKKSLWNEQQSAES
jgi:predicted MFS family arabinose efflux permease